MKKQLLLSVMLISFDVCSTKTVTEAINQAGGVAGLLNYGILDLSGRGITDLAGLNDLNTNFSLNYAAVTTLFLDYNDIATIPANIF